MPLNKTLLIYIEFVRANTKFYNIKPIHAQVLACICAKSPKTINSPTGNPFSGLSNKRIAEELGCSAKTVDRAMRVLEKLGFLKRVKKGNGKRRFREMHGLQEPIASYIDLQPLCQRNLNFEQERVDIDSQKEKKTKLVNKLTNYREELINSAESHSGALSADIQSKIEELRKQRFDRQNSKKLAETEISIAELNDMLTQAMLVPLAEELTANGGQNDLHIKLLSKGSKSSALKSGSVSDGVCGLSSTELEQAFPKAFEFVGGSHNIEDVVDTGMTHLRIGPAQCVTLCQNPNGTDRFILLILYLMQMDPDDPHAYLEALSKESAKGEFDIIKKTKSRFYASRARLKSNKTINEEGANHHA